MNYTEALQEIKNNSDLIGKKIQGGTIDELIIFPIDENSKNLFKHNYFKTLNAEISIKPHMSEEVSVCAVINKKNILQKIFLTVSLEEIQNELNK